MSWRAIRNTSLRQDIQREMERRGDALRLHPLPGGAPAGGDGWGRPRSTDLVYHPADAEEHFLSFDTENDKLAGFLRLSLPEGHPRNRDGGSGTVRRSSAKCMSTVSPLEVGAERAGIAQHSGLGTRLISEAERIAKAKGFEKLAVIAAVGTPGLLCRPGL